MLTKLDILPGNWTFNPTVRGRFSYIMDAYMFSQVRGKIKLLLGDQLRGRFNNLLVNRTGGGIGCWMICNELKKNQ